jgi:hypothetical protein
MLFNKVLNLIMSKRGGLSTKLNIEDKDILSSSIDLIN